MWMLSQEDHRGEAGLSSVFLLCVIHPAPVLHVPLSHKEKSRGSRANEVNGVTYCDSTVTTSSPLPNSSLHLLTGHGAGCRRVCWERSLYELRHFFFFLLNLWLTFWAVLVLCSYHKRNGTCSGILQECWDVAKVFGEQLGWDFSLAGAFCNVNKE